MSTIATRMRNRFVPRSPFDVLVTVLGLMIAFFVLFPLIRMFQWVFADNAGGFPQAVRNALGQPDLGQILLNTAIMVVGSGAIALVIGTAFAVLNERTDARMGWLTDLLPLVPFVVPPVATAVGWVSLASPAAGILNVYVREILSIVGIHLSDGPLDIFGWPGLIFVLAMFEVPFAYLLVSAALRNVDPALEESARVSGAGRLRTVVRVTIPSIKPALGASSFLMVIIGIAFFSIPIIIGTRAGIDVLTVRLVRLIRYTSPAQTDVAIIFGLIILVVVAVAWALQGNMLSQQRFGTIGGKGRRQARIALGRWRWVARSMMVAYIVIASVLPLLGLLLVSLQPFWSPRPDWSAMTLNSFRDVLLAGTRNTGAAFQNSLTLASIGATIGVVIAALLTLSSLRSRGTTARFVDFTTKLPAAIPNLIIAVGFILAFSGPPFDLHGTALILLIAYVVIYLPFATIVSGSAAGQIGHELAEAANVSGARPGRTFLRIQLPLMIPTLAAGWALLFIRMVGELTVSALLSTTTNPVVGFVLLDTFDNGSFSLVAALATVVSLVTALVVVVTLVLARDRVPTA